jgi:hypothetical protein
MTTPPATPLDLAHARMTAAPEDDAARLRYYEALADADLVLWLDAEAEGEALSPRLVELDDGPVVLAYDLEDRLAEAAGVAVAYAALPGRVIAAQLAGQGVALGVNLGTEAPAFLVPPHALDWLAGVLDRSPAQTQARPVVFRAPGALPPALVDLLAQKLARAGGLAQGALLAGVSYDDGRRGHMLAFVGAPDASQAPLARMAAEALAFSGVEAGEMDVAFLTADDPATAVMARVARAFDMPAPQAAPAPAPQAPGMDPDRPPRLR